MKCAFCMRPAPGCKNPCYTCDIRLCNRHWHASHCCICACRSKVRDHFAWCSTCLMTRCPLFLCARRIDGFAKKEIKEDRRCKNCLDNSPDGIIGNVERFVRSDRLLLTCTKHQPAMELEYGRQRFMSCLICNREERSGFRFTSIFHSLLPDSVCTVERSALQGSPNRIYLPFTCELCFARLVTMIGKLQRWPRSRTLNCAFFSPELLDLIGQYAFDLTVVCPQCT